MLNDIPPSNFISPSQRPPPSMLSPSAPQKPAPNTPNIHRLKDGQTQHLHVAQRLSVRRGGIDTLAHADEVQIPELAECNGGRLHRRPTGPKISRQRGTTETAFLAHTQPIRAYMATTASTRPRGDGSSVGRRASGVAPSSETAARIRISQ
ncbi:hypothetical protein BJ912DRAFT_1059673 [Pholiota molesta]|nr:hypothetical protein BJ912DRAFT_1059673 [Pholiota molesta]